VRGRRALQLYNGEEVHHGIGGSGHCSATPGGPEIPPPAASLPQVAYLCDFGRDLKPENFMLKKEGDITQLKLIDFGLSKDYSFKDVMSTPMGSVRIEC